VDAQGQASRYGVTIAGATVHLVDEHVDHGAIVIQAAVPTFPGEAPDALRARILAQEHRIYPYAIQLFAEGRVSVEGRRVRIRGIEGSERAALVNPPLPTTF
jgi:phosphoribosylglycinamide formyltransferase-1